MQSLQHYFQHLAAFDPAENDSIDRCHNLFLIGALLSKKPRHVLELGIGTGYLTVCMIHALRFNGVGDLTTVDDWTSWGGVEPPGIGAIRAGGVNIVAPVNIPDYLRQCRDGSYDFLIADASRLDGEEILEDLRRVAVSGAFFFAGNTRRVAQHNRGAALEDWLKVRGMQPYLFNESTRSDERCENGCLFAILDKSDVDGKAELDWSSPNRLQPQRSAHPSASVRSASGRKPKPPALQPVVDSEGDDARTRVSAGRSGAKSIFAGGQSRPQTLYLGLVAGEKYGWGVCSRYLIRELSRATRCHVLNSRDGTDRDPDLEGPLFQALTGVEFDPMYEKARGRENFGYTFFENELTRRSQENAKKYDTVLAGSSWCRDRMLEKGIGNCDLLIQGIDPQRFYPIAAPKCPDDFVIFSGGKFELRKGQDLVLKAVKILQEKYEDIVLVNCWYNIWPESMRLMAHSRHIRFEYRDLPWQQLMQHVYAVNGLDGRRIKTFDLVPSEMQREIYRQTDIGVFPNRCEGGTNLVLMEYMACGKPVIASNTSGHTDIVNGENALLLNDLAAYNITGPDNRLIARWQEPSLDELIARLEYAYHHRDVIRALGRRAADDLKAFTWAKSAERLLGLLGL